MSLEKRLTAERKRLGLSQAEFAKRIGVSLSSQKRYESGERDPDTGYLESAIIAGVDISFVLTGRRNIHESSDWNDSYLTMFAVAAANLLGITNDDLNGLVNSVDSVMSTAPFRDLSPEKSLPIFEDKFLIALSDLINHKGHITRKDGGQEVDVKILTDVLTELDVALHDANLSLATEKKARAAAMLYRSVKFSGKLDTKMVDETIALARP